MVRCQTIYDQSGCTPWYTQVDTLEKYIDTYHVENQGSSHGGNIMYRMAARLGDLTVHGGVIVTGYPTVLIGGQPAARIGDMHTCPIAIPGAPPHVGGIISTGTPRVLIGGIAAARVDDTAVCVGPLDVIIAGCPTVLIGGAVPVTTGGGPIHVDVPETTDLVEERQRVQGEIEDIDDRLDEIQRTIESNEVMHEAAPGGGMNPPRSDETPGQSLIRMLGEAGGPDLFPDGAEIAAGDAHRHELEAENEALEQEAGELRERQSGLSEQLDRIDGATGDEMIG